MFGFGKALKGLGGFLKGGEGGAGGSLFGDLSGLQRGLDAVSMAQAFSNGDYGAAIGLLSDMEKKRKEEEERRGAGIVAPRTQGFSPHGFGGGIY